MQDRLSITVKAFNLTNITIIFNSPRNTSMHEYEHHAEKKINWIRGKCFTPLWLYRALELWSLQTYTLFHFLNFVYIIHWRPALFTFSDEWFVMHYGKLSEYLIRSEPKSSYGFDLSSDNWRCKQKRFKHLRSCARQLLTPHPWVLYIFSFL